MIGDIAIIVFALIGIFAKKRWAVITATIWLITPLIIRLTVNFNAYSPAENVEDTFSGSFLLLAILETILVIMAWGSILRCKKRGIRLNLGFGYFPLKKNNFFIQLI